MAIQQDILAQSSRALRARPRPAHDWFPIVLGVLWIALAAAAAWPGLSYYRLPLSERPFVQDNALFAPTGQVGHGFGVLGSLMMAFGVASYAVSKRWRVVARLGTLKHWLQFHIFLCTLGPFLILLHTSFKFGGLVSIAFWSMTLVVFSGVFGRYVYARIPKSVNGQFRSLADLQTERDEIAALLERHGALSRSELAQLGLLTVAGAPTLFSALQRALRFDLGARRRARTLRELLVRRGVSAQARDRMAELVIQQASLQQQLALLAPFQRLFRYWHVLHLPLALLMFAILIIHVTVAFLFGYGWPH